MQRKVILYIATSLDGYIAKPQGDIDFLEKSIKVSEEDTSYQRLIEQVDTVIMGRATYDQVTEELSPDHYPYEEQMSYIYTNRFLPNTEKKKFTNQDPIELVQQLKNESGQAIWIVGGRSVITPLIEANLIDSYILATVPVLLGEGLPLTTALSQERYLQLKDVYTINGLVYTTYHKIEK